MQLLALTFQADVKWKTTICWCHHCMRERGREGQEGQHMLKLWSKTQAVVALSSAEAELGAEVEASQELLGIMTLWT